MVRINIGDVFGKLTVVSKAESLGHGSRWNCRCSCGKEVTIRKDGLISGHSRSCGCLSKEVTSKRCFLHGECNSSEYASWEAMVGRCGSTKSEVYKYYGGKGIKVCPLWRNSFSAFLKDMGRKPSPTHTVDRINGDGDYEPSNCRWATREEQARNRKNTRKIKWKDREWYAGDLAAEYGITRNVLNLRVYKYGWDLEKALTTPILVRSR